MAALFLQDLADLPCNRPYCFQIETAVAVAGRSDTDERDVGIEHGFYWICCRMEATVGMALFNQFSQPILDDRASARVNHRHFVPAHIDAPNFVAALGQASCSHAADIT